MEDEERHILTSTERQLVRARPVTFWRSGMFCPRGHGRGSGRRKRQMLDFMLWEILFVLECGSKIYFFK